MELSRRTAALYDSSAGGWPPCMTTQPSAAIYAMQVERRALALAKVSSYVQRTVAKTAQGSLSAVASTCTDLLLQQ